jgi:mRNA interferase YafQ
VYTPVYSKQFKRDYQKLSRSGRGVEDVDEILRLLISGDPLPIRCRDHSLKGEYHDYRECHVRPDLLLIYRIDRARLSLVRLGSHGELFE